MNLFDRLLAKGIRPDRLSADSPATLPGHLQSVFAAAEIVVAETGADQLQAVGLTGDEWLYRLRRVVLLAGALHDLGKANDHFQRMVHGDRKNRQGLRHEWVTYWLCQQKPWCDWGPQVAGSDDDWKFTLWAIAGHHPAKGRLSPPAGPPEGCIDSELMLLATYPDFRACVEWLEATFGAGLLPCGVPETDPSLILIGKRRSVFQELAQVQRDATWSRLSRSVEVKRFVAVVKAALLAADVAGSWAGQQADAKAAPVTRTTVAQNLDALRSGLDLQPQPADLEELVRIRLNGHPERDFQQGVATSSHRVTLVRAGCGSGKTAAAYLWAARAWPGRRLYFCYPTTGTATEGFRDYLFDETEQIPRLGSQLFHSRAAVDADLILHVDENDADADPDERRQRADALTAWSTPVVCCTIDRVICLLQNWRTGLMSWPALAQSVFVFDEIHAYDNLLFGLLLRFLRDCPGLPVLLMTASLPESRRAAILRVLRHNNPQATDDELLGEVSGPADLEDRPRYHRHTADHVEQLIADEVARGGRVLQVCNTVPRAMEATARLQTLGLDPMIYHSRFRYCDRLKQHERVIQAFRSRHAGDIVAGAVAISTQVAEMSLDLQAATLLVTDLCPVPSLIQRLGRLNRVAEDGDPTRPFVVVDATDDNGKFTHLPYGLSEEEFGNWPEETRAWLDSLGSGPISQRQLADAWQSRTHAPVPVHSKCCWLDSGPVTSVDVLREGSYGQTVLLESDRAKVESRRMRLAEVALPMPPIPKHLESVATQRYKGVLVVPDSAIEYSPGCGAAWKS